MIKESRVVVRLIALWVIFTVSLGLIFWSGQQFAVSLVKLSSGNYGDNGCMPGGYCPPPMTFTSCIQPPPYPVSQGMGDALVAPMDREVTDKYNKDYAEYSKSYQKACEQDVTHQQGAQKSSSVTDLAGFSVMLLLAAVSAVASLMAIKKSELEM